MKKNPLFPKMNGFLHGGDYNPEQWLDRPDILENDIKLMLEAKINCVTLGVFSWSIYEPVEGCYNFDWLEDIINNLFKNGIYTILATPSGARPAWLDEKYPDAMRVDSYNHRNHHGVRHNHCMTSLNYRKKVEEIDTLLAKRFANNPAILLWHISNELGGECYCDSCRQGFQKWLANRYNNNIENLNNAWWTTFWSHRYNNFEQIDPPYSNGENCVMGQNLDWKRYTSWLLTDFMDFEIQVLRKINSNIPVTTNYMDTFWGIDYHEMSKKIDVVSWDSYPQMHNDFESIQDNFLYTAFNHALYRSMKIDRPWLLMESAPGVTNWQRVNKCRRPGFHNLSGIQAIACGSDSVQYFQIRKSRGSSEQYHGAVIDHMGTNETRIFQEVAALGENLSKISEIAGTLAKNQVAFIWDWDNRWAINDAWTLSNDSKKYEDTLISMWKQFLHLGIDPDVISSDNDWSQYKVIIAPMLYLLHDEVGTKIRDFVSKGGQFLMTYFSGYVDKSTLCYLGGFPGQSLSEVFGIISEEIDSLYPSDRNTLKVAASGHEIEVFEYQEYLRVSDAEILATYNSDYVKDRAAITKKAFGSGNAYYLACRTAAEDIRFIFEDMLTNADIPFQKLPPEIEFHQRFDENSCYSFYINTAPYPVSVSSSAGYDILNEREVSSEITINAVSAAIVKSEF